MYQLIKSGLLKIIPKKLILKNEIFFRRIYAVAFIGLKYQCPVCNRKLRKFIPVSQSDLLCPNCGSLARNRRLYCLLKEEFLKDNIKILDFSPSRCLYRKLKEIKSIDYTANNFYGEFLADKNMDITHLEESNESFDLIICYHVLEHVKDDVKAMSELFRVLKPEGMAIIQTPFKEGDIYEDESIISDEDRRVHFGLEDHLRIYSIKGLCRRLESAGFKINVINCKENYQNYHGFSVNETIILCNKQSVKSMQSV